MEKMVVVLMGSLAMLDKSDPKVNVVAKLLGCPFPTSAGMSPRPPGPCLGGGGWKLQRSRVSNPDGCALCPSFRGLPSLFRVRNALVESQLVTMFWSLSSMCIFSNTF